MLYLENAEINIHFPISPWMVYKFVYMVLLVVMIVVDILTIIFKCQMDREPSSIGIICCIFMAALCNRVGHYIFACAFFSFFPRLIPAVGDWIAAILPHIVWL